VFIYEFEFFSLYNMSNTDESEVLSLHESIVIISENIDSTIIKDNWQQWKF